jgi:hypothetical protein
VQYGSVKFWAFEVSDERSVEVKKGRGEFQSFERKKRKRWPNNKKKTKKIR